MAHGVGRTRALRQLLAWLRGLFVRVVYLPAPATPTEVDFARVQQEMAQWRGIAERSHVRGQEAVLQQERMLAELAEALGHADPVTWDEMIVEVRATPSVGSTVPRPA